MADSKLVCLHCALEFSAADGRQHGRHFRCKNCESALRQIRRNLDSSDLENFTPEEQRDFFRNPLAMAACHGPQSGHPCSRP